MRGTSFRVRLGIVVLGIAIGIIGRWIRSELEMRENERPIPSNSHLRNPAGDSAPKQTGHVSQRPSVGVGAITPGVVTSVRRWSGC